MSLTLTASPNPIAITGSSTLTATSSLIPNQYQFFKDSTLLSTASISLSSSQTLSNVSLSKYFIAVSSDDSGNIYTLYQDSSNQIYFYKFNSTFTTILITILTSNATGLAIDSTNRIYLSGPNYIKRYDSTGSTLQLTITLPSSPIQNVLAIDQNNNIFVGIGKVVYVYDLTGTQLYTVDTKVFLTGICVDTTLPYPNIYFAGTFNTTTNKNNSGCCSYNAFTNSYSLTYSSTQTYLNPKSVQLLNNYNYFVLDDNAFIIYQHQTSNGTLIKTYSTNNIYNTNMSYNQATNTLLRTINQDFNILKNSFSISSTYIATSYGSYSVIADYSSSYTLTASTTLLSIPYTITWDSLTDLTYGDPLPADYLNATASISGTFTYNVTAGEILPANETTGNELIATFTPTNTNIYAPTNTSNFLIVNKYTPLISWPSLLTQPINTTTPLTNENELNAVATDYNDNVLDGTYVYTDTTTSTVIQEGDTLPVGLNDLSVLFTPTDISNYNTNTETNQILVGDKLVVTITWNIPSQINYGTPLSSTQLNATATDSLNNPVSGTFTYLPASGTILNAGYRLLRCIFIPDDLANYYPRRSRTYIVVNTIDPVVVWTRPYDIYHYTPLSITEYDASFLGYDGSPISGTSTYNPVIGTTLSNGYHTLQITFDPTSANYNNKIATQQIYSLGPIAYSPLEPTIPIDQKSVTITFSGGIKYTFVPDRWNKKVNDQTYIFSPPFPINFLVIAESPTGLQLETIFPVYKKLTQAEEIDNGIIPFAIAIEVYDRRREFLWNYFKENPTLVKQLSNFFYQSLFVNYNDASKGKDGSCAKVPWRTEYEYIKATDGMVLSSKQQYELLRYVYQQQKKGLATNSNYGYLMFLLGDFMQNLQQAMNAYKTKQENVVCYYHLGKNINSPEELYKFLLQYTY
jgi:hypothetical protein